MPGPIENIGIRMTANGRAVVHNQNNREKGGHVGKR